MESYRQLSRPGLRLGLIAAAWVLGLAAAPLAAQRFSQSTDVVVVEVPVQVVRDGKPVRGLTRDDFVVYEGRRKQEITGFEVLDLAAVPADKPEAVRRMPMSARRRFVLLFDLGFSKPTSMTRAREAAKRLLHGSFHPSDLIAVAAYLPSKGPQLLLGFTTNRALIEAAIERLSPVQNQFAADPLLLAGAEAALDTSFEAPTPQALERSGYESPYTGREATVSQAAAYERSMRDSRRATLAAFTRSLAVFAEAMAAVDGRKHVLFLSEGFDSALAIGTVDEAEIQQMDTFAVVGDVWNIDNDQRYGNTKAGSDLEKMLETLRRADCAVHAVDIGGVRASADDLRAARSQGADGLFIMANSTGGELYQNFNDLGAAMEKMLDRTSVTYVLSFQPEVKHDGQYRKLRVELKNAAGARVVYRPGYYAPKPYGQRSATEKILQTAGEIVSGAEGGPVGLAVLAAPFKMPGGKAYVPVVIEIDGPTLLAGHQGTALPAEIYVYAMDAQGAVQDFFTQTMSFDLAKVGDAVRETGIKVFGDLDLAPGTFSVRVLARNGQTGAAGMRVASLEVPAFAQASPVLLPPFFPEPAGRWLVVREAKVREGEVPYPFMSRKEPYVPASRPVLLPDRAVPLSLIGYGLGKGRLTAQATVMTAEGKEVGEGMIGLVGRESAGAEGPERLAATFQPPQLQPGEYLLLVTVTNPEGKAETSVAPFTIQNPAKSGGTGS
jgi:VWFA-related protein